MCFFGLWEREREGVSGLERKKRLVVEEKLKESFGKEEKSDFRERDREMWFFGWREREREREREIILENNKKNYFNKA